MRLKFNPKLGPTLAAVAGVIVTAYLGSWQLDRAAYKLDLQRRAELALAQPPVRLSATPTAARDLAFYKVEALGQFRPELTILLDNKVHAGVVGYEVVTPLRIGESKLHVLVDRGWIKAPAVRTQLPDIATPTGVVRVEGMALPPPTRYIELSSNTVTGKVWQNLQFQRYRDTFGIDLQPLLLQQHNDLGDGLVRDWPRPDTGVNIHRAYALQWFVMSVVIAILYLVLNVRRKDEPLGTT